VIDAYSSGNHVKAYTLIKTGASIYVYVNYGDPLDSADFSSENGKLRVMGLREDNRAYIWIQNTDSTWWNYIHELGLDSQTGTLTISGFRSGCTYTVEWWDPWESEVGQQIISSSLVEANVLGELSIDLRNYRQEGIRTDAAVIIYPQDCENPLLSWLPLIYAYD